MPRMPSPTTTATVIRMIFKPVLARAGVAAADEAGVPATDGTLAPHLGQNLAEGSNVAPQELQNAIGHLAAVQDCLRGRSISQLGLGRAVCQCLSGCGGRVGAARPWEATPFTSFSAVCEVAPLPLPKQR